MRRYFTYKFPNSPLGVGIVLIRSRYIEGTGRFIAVIRPNNALWQPVPEKQERRNFGIDFQSIFNLVAMEIISIHLIGYRVTLEKT